MAWPRLTPRGSASGIVGLYAEAPPDLGDEERTADVINESLLRAHLWAVDRNLTKTYVDDVVESVNDFLRRLIAQGAILSGRCWADPALNTASAREAGRVYFNFEFDPPSPAERITFRSHLVSGEVA